ncbi:Sucrose transport protein [Entamoeba marina]
MAPRSLALYLKLFAVCCIQMGVQFSYSSIFGLSGPLFGKQFKMSSTGTNIIFSFVGPMIGFFVQPLFGAIGDRCTFKFGRRRIFIVVGALIDVVGMVVIASATIIDMLLGNIELDPSDSYVDDTTAMDHIVATIIALVGLFIAFFGVNIIQGPSRAIISDVIDVENQQDANLMVNACSGFASVACYGISAGTVSVSYTFLIMFGLCAAVVFVSAIPTVIFSKEERYVLEDGEKVNILRPFIDLFGAIKMINLDIIFLLLGLMFGWFAFQPFNTNIVNYYGYTIYGGYTDDNIYNDGMTMGLILMCVFAICQSVSVAIFPLISDTIGEVTTFLVFQALGGVSYGMLCVVDYTFPKDYHSDETKPQFYASLALSFVSIAFPAMAFVQTNSLPYSMLKKVVPPARFGAFVGLLNCAVVIAQFLSSGCTALIQIIYDEYLVPIILSCLFSFLASAVSVVLFRVEKRTQDPLLTTALV